MSQGGEARAGSDGRLVPVPSTRDHQTQLSGGQLTAEMGELMKTALALQPPAIPAPQPWHICMGTPQSVPRSHRGGPKTPPLWGEPCASLVAPGQSCWRWQADDNEISNISTISFSETDLTTLSPTRTLVKVNPLFGAGESLADAAPAAGPGSPQTLGRLAGGLGLPVLGSGQSTGTGRELQCSCFQNTSRLPPPKHFSIYGPAAGSQGDECAGLSLRW